jgi:hypothetical protein
MRKQAKKHFFRIEAKKISRPFRFISLRSENDGSFLLPFRFISLQSEKDGSFCFFFVLFSLRSIFVSLQISTFRIDAKQAKKALATEEIIQYTRTFYPKASLDFRRYTYFKN